MKYKYIVPTLIIVIGLIQTACNSGGGGETNPDTGGTNSPPIAEAGQNQSVAAGSVVALDGSGSSDADQDSLSDQWEFTSKPAGSAAALSSAISTYPTFTADKNGTYVISLVVNDGIEDSTADSVTITASTNDFGPIDESRVDTNIECIANTTIAGGNINNQTWTAANSPYLVQGDITVLSGATLTIEPLVTVCTATTDSMGAGTNAAKVEITVNGTLSVSGSATAPVIFRSVEATDLAGKWVGIILSSTSTGNIVDYAFIANAENGIANSGSLEVTNSVFMNNGTGVELSNDASIYSSVFLKNMSGVVVQSNATAYLANLLIYENTNYGIYINWSASIYNCTIDNNGYGVYFWGSGSPISASIINFIITRNPSYGIYRPLSSTGTLSVSYSNIWNNGSNLYNVSLGSGMSSSNPLYVSSTSPLDYSLASGSPSIDAGTDTSLATDILGTARPRDGDGVGGAVDDLGAYEM